MKLEKSLSKKEESPESNKLRDNKIIIDENKKYNNLIE